ncbi:MAG: hypothetical protein WBL56_06320 [Candidatus Acidiferrum sp.]
MGRGLGAVVGRGRLAVVEILIDGVTDGSAPAVGAEGVDVFVLGEMEGLNEGLGEVGESRGGSGFYIAASDGG